MQHESGVCFLVGAGHHLCWLTTESEFTIGGVHLLPLNANSLQLLSQKQEQLSFVVTNMKKALPILRELRG